MSLASAVGAVPGATWRAARPDVPAVGDVWLESNAVIVVTATQGLGPYDPAPVLAAVQSVPDWHGAVAAVTFLRAPGYAWAPSAIPAGVTVDGLTP